MHSLFHSKRLGGIAIGGIALSLPLGLGVVTAAQAAPAPDIKVTQNSSDAVVDFDGIACSSNDTGFVSDNQFYRRFDLSQYGAANGFTVSKMTAGVEVGDSSDGTVPGDFKIYAMDHSVGANFTVADLGTALASVPVNFFTATGDTLISAPITATVPAGKDMVIEVSVDEAATDQTFYPGANEAPETGPTYLTSAGCGITAPTTLADIGFDGLANVFWVNGKTTDCKNAEASVTSATAAAATASQAVTKASGDVAKAKKKLKKAKKSHNANKIKKAKKKLKKAKQSLKAAQAASAAANAALATATATQGTKCAQPALPQAPVRPAQSSSHHPSTGATNGFSLSTSRS